MRELGGRGLCLGYIRGLMEGRGELRWIREGGAGETGGHYQEAVLRTEDVGHLSQFQECRALP